MRDKYGVPRSPQKPEAKEDTGGGIAMRSVSPEYPGIPRAGACPSGPRNGFFTTERTEATEDGTLQVSGTTRAVAVPLANLPPSSVCSVYSVVKNRRP